jgi:peptidoglycan/LPS O-acetylase OafA/YrhL
MKYCDLFRRARLLELREQGRRQDQHFFGGLEAMRGVAALIVALMHMPPLVREQYVPGLIENGYLMVPFFFVLSGFVIHLNYFEFIRDGRGLSRFMFLRLGRLYPVHFVFLLLWLGVEVARYIAAQHYGVHAPVTQPFRENSPTAFIEHLFLVQALGFSNASTFNVPSWSISVEFYTYFLFALSVLFARRLFLPLALAIVCAGLVLFGAQLTGDFGPLVHCITGFFIGCLISIVSERVRPTPLASAITVILFLSILMTRPLPAAWFVIYPLSAALVFSLLNESGIVTKALMLSPLRWLGRISYSLYMSHALVFWCASMVLAKLIGADLSLPAEARYQSISPVEAATAYVVILGLALMTAAATYRWVEAPGRRWSRAQIIFRPQLAR